MTGKQLLHRQLNITENSPQKAGPDCFARMHRYRSHPSVLVFEEDVTTSSPNNFKSNFFEKTYEFLALQARKASHTEICWIPTSSSDGVA